MNIPPACEHASHSTLLLVPHSLPDPDTPAWPALALGMLGDLVERAPGLTVAVFERLCEQRRAALALSGLVEILQITEHPALGNGIVLTSREDAVRRPQLLRSARTLVVSRLPLPWPRSPRAYAPAGEAPRRFLRHDMPRSAEAFRAVVAPFLAAIPGQPRLLVVLDPRLVNRPYGRWFLHALAGLRRCRELDEAIAHLSAGPGVTL
jgi:hypothetical protein